MKIVFVVTAFANQDSWLKDEPLFVGTFDEYEAACLCQLKAENKGFLVNLEKKSDV